MSSDRLIGSFLWAPVIATAFVLSGFSLGYLIVINGLPSSVVGALKFAGLAVAFAAFSGFLLGLPVFVSSLILCTPLRLADRIPLLGKTSFWIVYGGLAGTIPAMIAYIGTVRLMPILESDVPAAGQSPVTQNALLVYLACLCTAGALAGLCVSRMARLKDLPNATTFE